MDTVWSDHPSGSRRICLYYRESLDVKKKFFFLSGFSFTNIHRTAGEGGGYLLDSSLPLPPASQTLRH